MEVMAILPRHAVDAIFPPCFRIYSRAGGTFHIVRFLLCSLLRLRSGPSLLESRTEVDDNVTFLVPALVLIEGL